MKNKSEKPLLFIAECPNGCGWLSFELTGQKIGDGQYKKDVRCKDCENITVAERET